MFAWHRDALSRRAARKDAVLVMYDVQGQPVARYHLESAWPAKLVVGGDKVGAGQLLFETVTLACDAIQFTSLRDRPPERWPRGHGRSPTTPGC